MFFRRSTLPPRVPQGVRAYAVGDIHGRVDLLDLLLSKIEVDDSWRPKVRRKILIFLGDYIDRGPDSASVIERLRRLGDADIEPHFIAGNHEEALLRILAGEKGILKNWLRLGGSECLMSYNLDPRSIVQMNDEAKALKTIRKAIPASHRLFLENCVDSVRCGDYLFVHAGVNPAVDLSLQKQRDLRWIRNRFLDHKEPFDAMIVHGHTVTDAIDWQSNRIGVDTGAYRSGLLSAIGLEGSERWTVDTAI